MVPVLIGLLIQCIKCVGLLMHCLNIISSTNKDMHVLVYEEDVTLQLSILEWTKLVWTPALGLYL